MERLTYRDKDGFPMMKKRGGFKQGGVERLAAYEDTRLEPEEVSSLVKDWSDLCTIVGECGGLDRVRAQAELDKARAAGAEWNRRNGIKLKGRECDGKC